MSTNFLGALGNQLSSQFNLGENTTRTLDSVEDGQNVKYGSLGDLASRVDRSAERKYVEEGYLRQDAFNAKPKQFEILMQQPSATVFVKKRMFSSLAESFRLDYMDKDERLYLKCINILFNNKCQQISAYEKLSKIQKTSEILGQIDSGIMPLIFTLGDTISQGFDSGINLFGALGKQPGSDVSKFLSTLNTLRKLYTFNQPNNYTTWISDRSNLFRSSFGEGTGVIELTNFTQINTNTGLTLSSGGANFSISDPYGTMLITEYDIERAISEGTNAIYNSRMYQLGKESADQLINDLQAKLNRYRANRKVSQITFKVNPDTILSKRVVAIIEGVGREIPFSYDSNSAESIFSGGAFGKGVSVSLEYLMNGEVAGIEGLDPIKKVFSGFSKDTHRGIDSELSVFSDLVAAIYKKLSLMANSVNTFQTNAKNTNYTRRKMRSNFLGKLIIQPMDVVHIYLKSNTSSDDQVLAGLTSMMTGNGYLNKIKSTMTSAFDTVKGLFNPSKSITFLAEKQVMVGDDFPNYLWASMRNQFISENEGTHVFAGLVDNSSDDWSDGNYSVQVSCKSNSAYFEMGQVNFNPGVDVSNGAIFDPLTAFKSKFDSIVSSDKSATLVPLDENILLLGGDLELSTDPNTNKELNTKARQQTINSLIKHKFGPRAGVKATVNNLLQDTSFNPNTGNFTKTYYMPDGMVYKWKEGISVLTQFGAAEDLRGSEVTGYPKISQSPFAGQDVMNVISLLITGQLYNFATYWKASTNTGAVGRDPIHGKDSASSYMDSLRESLSKNNSLWGNFIPFKNLVVDEQTYSSMIREQEKLTEKTAAIDSKLEELRVLKSQLNIGSLPRFNSTDFSNLNSVLAGINSSIKILQDQVEAQIKDVSTIDKNQILIGDEILLDEDAITATIGDKTNITSDQSRKLLRRQLNTLTKRMSYDVRSNEDKNFFIVDDYYDKDYDIVAFNKDLTDGIKAYDNAFTTVSDKISTAAKLLNLEVFCDPQGHIRARPPQYNRMPSSVFYRMMYLKSSTGIQIFPQFLQDIFKDQIETLSNSIEILEDQIRLYCAALGYFTDEACKWFIGDNNTMKAENKGDAFNFATLESGGWLGNIEVISQSANAEELTQAKETFNKIKGQGTSRINVFNTAYRAQILLTSIKENKLANSGYYLTNITAFEQNQRVSDLISRIETKSGKKISKQYFVKTSEGDFGPFQQKVIDVFKITKELSGFIADRQKKIKMLYSSMKNSAEYRSLDDNKNTQNSLLATGGYDNSKIPEMFEHMIEEESYDDLGPGSGNRYIIRRPQIKNMHFTERNPPYTSVQVSGRMNEYDQSLPEGLNNFPSGGNPVTSAFAIDYDMWRNYGLSTTTPVEVPFFRNPHSQCAPFATMLLSRARKEVLTGNITINGNEYMQPGEVVYIEDRGLLFYVTEVRHQFAFGSGFTTDLTLSYGHAPGDYIPTTLDVVGKMIINNRDIANIRVERQMSTVNELNVGVIQMDANTNSTPIQKATDKSNQLTNKYTNANLKTIQDMLFTCQVKMQQNNSKDKDSRYQIQFRIYHDNTKQINSSLQEFAGEMRKQLIGKLSNGLDEKSVGPNSNKYFNADDVLEPVIVNLSEDNPKTPSQKAMTCAKLRLDDVSSLRVDSGSVSSAAERNKLKSALFGYIVDCWIVKTNTSAK